MASSFSFSPDEAQKPLIQDGYFAVPNADVGHDALDFRDKSVPFLTPFGLDFCVQSSWDNEVSWLEPILLGPLLIIR